MLKIVLAVFVGGAVGGALNGIVSGQSFVLIQHEPGTTVPHLGILENLIVGGLAAVISFGLYGPLAARAIITSGAAEPKAQSTELTLAALAGAILIGFSGGSWITAEADKQLAQNAARETAQGAQVAIHRMNDANPKLFNVPNGKAANELTELLTTIATSNPAEANRSARAFNAEMAKLK